MPALLSLTLTKRIDEKRAAVQANDPISASDAALTVVDLSVAKKGYITLVPSELLQDATFDLEGYLARAAGRELGTASKYVEVAYRIPGSPNYLRGDVQYWEKYGWVFKWENGKAETFDDYGYIVEFWKPPFPLPQPPQED